MPRPKDIPVIALVIAPLMIISDASLRSVLFGEFSTVKEERQNTYMHSLKFDRVEVGSQIDLLLFQSELYSKAIAVSHDSI